MSTRFVMFASDVTKKCRRKNYIKAYVSVTALILFTGILIRQLVANVQMI